MAITSIFRFMNKFDKISIEAILCCSLDAYLSVIISDLFHFLYFKDQCEMLSKFCQIYDVWLLRIRVRKLWKIIWIEAGWMRAASVKSMKRVFLSFCNMLKNTQSLLMRHTFVLVFVVLTKYVMTWAQCVIIYSSSV